MIIRIKCKSTKKMQSNWRILFNFYFKLLRSFLNWNEWIKIYFLFILFSNKIQLKILYIHTHTDLNGKFVRIINRLPADSTSRRILSNYVAEYIPEYIVIIIKTTAESDTNLNVYQIQALFKRTRIAKWTLFSY